MPLQPFATASTWNFQGWWTLGRVWIGERPIKLDENFLQNRKWARKALLGQILWTLKFYVVRM